MYLYFDQIAWAKLLPRATALGDREQTVVELISNCLCGKRISVLSEPQPTGREVHRYPLGCITFAAEPL
jgi:hypothetical protein